MGAYRLLLALLVALSHMGVKFWGVNLGVVAVISFFIISGFVMTSLIERHYRSLDKVGLFYLDRLLRLYPQFIVYFVMSCLVIYFMLPGTPQAATLTAKNILTSLPILPLGFYMYGITLPQILPPAWSLGLEMCFYLLIPFLLIYKVRGGFFLASLLVFFVAFIGKIDNDIYGYRLLPGVLFIFLCGSYLYQAKTKELFIVATTTLVAALLFLAIMSGAITRLILNAEVTLGIAVGIPAVYLLSKLKYHPIDEFFGNISYGVFLNHFVVMYALRHFWPVEYSVPIICAVLVLSFLLSGVTYYCVEKPALILRHTLRARSNARPQAMEPVAPGLSKA